MTTTTTTTAVAEALASGLPATNVCGHPLVACTACGIATYDSHGNGRCNDHAMDTIAAATFLLDGDEYVARGAVSRFDGTPSEWAERFVALGGRRTSVEPAWRTGAPDVTFYVSGSDEAVAFVAATAPVKGA